MSEPNGLRLLSQLIDISTTSNDTNHPKATTDMSGERPNYKKMWEDSQVEIDELKRKLHEASTNSRDDHIEIGKFQERLANRISRKIASMETEYCRKSCSFAVPAETSHSYGSGSDADGQCRLKDRYKPLARKVVSYATQDFFDWATKRSLPIEDFLIEGKTSLGISCEDPSAKPGSRTYSVTYKIIQPHESQNRFDKTRFSRMLEEHRFDLKQDAVPEEVVHRHLLHSDRSEWTECLV